MFGINKYDACQSWGLKEWCSAISYRVFLQKDWSRSFRKNFDIEDEAVVYANYKSHACQLIENPLNQQGIYYGAGQVTLIKDQCVADLFEDGEDERLQDSSWRTDYLEWLATDPFTLYETNSRLELVKRIENTPTWLIKKDVFGQTGIASINVNLGGTDDEIVKEFKGWLKRTRNQMSLPRGSVDFDAGTFSSWCKNCVLPCFDLVFYEQIFKGNFRIKDFTEALFPSFISLNADAVSEDQVRRTIIPNSLKTVSSTTAMALRSKMKEEKQKMFR